jgi:hypothetical protein
MGELCLFIIRHSAFIILPPPCPAGYVSSCLKRVTSRRVFSLICLAQRIRNPSQGFSEGELIGGWAKNPASSVNRTAFEAPFDVVKIEDFTANFGDYKHWFKLLSLTARKLSRVWLDAYTLKRGLLVGRHLGNFIGY